MCWQESPSRGPPRWWRLLGLWALGLDQQPCIRAEPKDAQEVWKAGRTRKSYGDGLALEGQFRGTLRTFVQI